MFTCFLLGKSVQQTTAMQNKTLEMEEATMPDQSDGLAAGADGEDAAGEDGEDTEDTAAGEDTADMADGDGQSGAKHDLMEKPIGDEKWIIA